MEISGFNKTDASQTIFVEGQARATVNNNARELMGAVARAWFDSVEGDRDSSGSSNAYVVAANRTLSAYYDGLRVGFHANHSCTGAATLNIDAIGAKTIKKNHDQDLASGDIEQHQYVEVVYSASDDTFQMLSPVANAPASTGANTFTANQVITSTDAGAVGPQLTLYHNSASPAASDGVGYVNFNGEDSNSDAITYVRLFGEIVDATDGSADGRAAIQTIIADTLASRVYVGAGLYTAGVSDMGANTINATTVYQAGKKLGFVQRQETTKTDTSTIAITAGTFSDVTGMSVSITAVSGSRIVIEGTLTLGVQSGPEVAYLILLRDSTVISPVGASPSNRKAATWALECSANSRMNTLHFKYVDTAPDGSAHTYKLQMTAQTSENWHVNRSESDTDNNTFARMGSWIAAEEYGV